MQLCYHSQKVHFSNLLFFSHRPSFPSQPVYPIYPYVLLFSSSKKQRIGIVFPVIHCYLTFYTYHPEFIFSKYHTLDRQGNAIKFSSEITQPWKKERKAAGNRLLLFPVSRLRIPIIPVASLPSSLAVFLVSLSK